MKSITCVLLFALLALSHASQQPLPTNFEMQIDESLLSQIIYEIGPILKNVTTNVVSTLPPQSFKVVSAQDFKLTQFELGHPKIDFSSANPNQATIQVSFDKVTIGIKAAIKTLFFSPKNKEYSLNNLKLSFRFAIGQTNDNHFSFQMDPTSIVFDVTQKLETLKQDSEEEKLNKQENQGFWSSLWNKFKNGIVHAAEAIVGTYNKAVSFIFNKLCNFVITEVLKSQFLSNQINNFLKTFNLQVPITEKRWLRLQVSDGPQVLSQRLLKVSLSGDFVDAPLPIATTKPVPAPAANDPITTNVQSQLVKEVNNNPEQNALQSPKHFKRYMAKQRKTKAMRTMKKLAQISKKVRRV